MACELHACELGAVLTLTEATDTKAPFGNVSYADPGYQTDKKARYPIDTEAHVRAAWSYINQTSNQSGYSADQVSKIKARIMAAGRKLGIQFTESLRGRDLIEAATAITREDGLSSDEADLLLGRLISLEMVQAKESGDAMDVVGDVVSIRERAVASDGVATIKLIAPGWGSSGHYGESILKRDIPTAFPVGTKMHWDHPTLQEERERPEGSLRTLAAETVSVPRWQDGPDGPGMYADAKVFENFRKPVEELAPHIGVSIRAEGRGREGEVEGRKGNVVEQISRGHSVDFVTKPGAGGKVVQLFESYREGGSMTTDQKTAEQLAAEQKAADDKAAADKAAADKAAADKAAADAATTTTTSETTTAATESERTRRLEERLAMREAGDIVRTLLSTKGGVPDVTAKRLTETLPTKIALTSDGELDRDAFRRFAGEQIDAEIAYISEATGAGRVSGMGSVTEEDIKPEEAKAIKEGLRENFVALGSTKEQAALAIRE